MRDQSQNPEVFPKWNRMTDLYANFQEFQMERPLPAWRLEEAMYRLRGRGYAEVPQGLQSMR